MSSAYGKGWRPQVAVFPLVNLPTGDEDRGLGAGHVLVFLPMWFQKSFGDWTIDGGGGYWINQGGVGDKNFWFSGLLLQRKGDRQTFCRWGNIPSNRRHN